MRAGPQLASCLVPGLQLSQQDYLEAVYSDSILLLTFADFKEFIIVIIQVLTYIT